jgi:hypothetical protein
VYVLARAAWIPTLVIWHADGRFTRLDGAPCDEYAAALAASWRLRPSLSRSETYALAHGELPRRPRPAR